MSVQGILIPRIKLGLSGGLLLADGSFLDDGVRRRHYRYICSHPQTTWIGAGSTPRIAYFEWLAFANKQQSVRLGLGQHLCQEVW